MVVLAGIPDKRTLYSLRLTGSVAVQGASPISLATTEAAENKEDTGFEVEHALVPPTTTTTYTHTYKNTLTHFSVHNCYDETIAKGGDQIKALW